MEYVESNVISQSAAQDQINYARIEQQLIEANREISDLQSQLQWLERSYE